jgi:hypothetical protein
MTIVLGFNISICIFHRIFNCIGDNGIIIIIIIIIINVLC